MNSDKQFSDTDEFFWQITFKKMGISTLLSFSSLVFLINVMHQESGNHQTLKRNQNLFLIFMIKDEIVKNTPSQVTVLTSEIFQLLWN